MPFQIPTVAESHCKFRLWNCLSYSQDGETAGLHKAIINIKRLRRQAVAAVYIIVKFSEAVYGLWSGTLTVEAKKSIFKRVSVKKPMPVFLCIYH